MAQDPICGMQVNEKKGIRIEHEGRTYFFCSARCADKFSREKGLPGKKCPACRSPRTKWYANKAVVVAAVLGALYGTGFFVPVLRPFRQALAAYAGMIWWAVLLGLVLGGVIDHFIPREYISAVLSRPRKRTILYSVFLGFLMSACSHGILALAIQLHKKGASGPAVVAFLLASPWANITLTIMLFGFFGAGAVYIIGSALVIGIVSGYVFQFLEKKGLIEKNTHTADVVQGFSIREDIVRRGKNYRFSARRVKKDLKGIFDGSLALGNMVLWWILIGMGIASAANAYIPQELFQAYMGPTLLGLGLTLALATVIEVCSEGSAPLAFAIFRETGALGNSFVFLMAGVATDYTEIGLIWHNVGRKTALWLPAVTVPQVLVLGYLANVLW
ncbi:MAG: YHS domain-containing protein [Candidatus Omnitrophica bacterium]|nr:YHS domain-containing protein [Candidatus Omnitrophota bacterium]